MANILTGVDSFAMLVCFDIVFYILHV